MLTLQRFEPIAMAYGDAPGCKRCGQVPMRIEYARDIQKAQLVIVVVCKAHHVMRSLDLGRIAAAEPASSMETAIVTEIKRKFDDVLIKSSTETTQFTKIIRRPITCGNCGAPSDPKKTTCAFCGAHLAGVDR